jgi:hypothetical protein
MDEYSTKMKALYDNKFKEPLLNGKISGSDLIKKKENKIEGNKNDLNKKEHSEIINVNSDRNNEQFVFNSNNNPSMGYQYDDNNLYHYENQSHQIMKNRYYSSKEIFNRTNIILGLSTLFIYVILIYIIVAYR